MAECCSECGFRVGPNATSCPGCGTDVTEASATGDPTSTAAAPTRASAPIWSLLALGGLWAAGVYGIVSGGSVGIGLGLLAVASSLPLLWWDARAAKRAGRLEAVGSPIGVPLLCLMLWILAVPAYVVYRTVE